jgi:N-acetyl-gamma-glutamyl-phosphate reductase
MIRALVFGATGYTGLELIRILGSHPDAAIVGGSSRNWAGKKASEALPFISAEQDFSLRSIEELKLDPQADLAFLALPHGESAGLIRPLLDAGLKVVDLSADVRLSNLETYEKWYGPHRAAELLGQAVYGLPEIHREAIKKAALVANPGCYPTTAILGTAPLIGLSEVDTTCPVWTLNRGSQGPAAGQSSTPASAKPGKALSHTVFSGTGIYLKWSRSYRNWQVGR